MAFFVLTVVFLALLFAAFVVFKSVLQKERTRGVAVAKAVFEALSSDDAALLAHTVHVFELSDLLYSYLPLRMRARLSRQRLSYAALVHDIGKILVPQEILCKPGKLSKEEAALVQRHVDLGKDLICRDKRLDFLAGGILFHHERADGNGYKKIKGADIPLEAKIIAVADTYSAVVLANSFKPSRPYQDGITSLKFAAGSQLDKTLVDIFASIPQNKVNACAEKAEAALRARSPRAK